MGKSFINLTNVESNKPVFVNRNQVQYFEPSTYNGKDVVRLCLQTHAVYVTEDLEFVARWFA